MDPDEQKALNLTLAEASYFFEIGLFCNLTSFFLKNTFWLKYLQKYYPQIEFIQEVYPINPEGFRYKNWRDVYIDLNERRFKSNLLKLITFNLGLNIAKNLVEGTERDLVLLCRETYPELNGISDEDQNIGQCTINAIKWIFSSFEVKPYDFIAFQEISEETLNYIEEKKLANSYQFFCPNKISLCFLVRIESV